MTQMQWIKIINEGRRKKKKKIMCTCGWEGTAGDMIAEWSDIEPHCPECWGDNFDDIEDDPALTKIGELVEAINEHTEKLERMDKYENRP